MRVLRAADRFETRADGARTLHCFSFGAHFDPGNVGFGALMACNDEQLAPGGGYDPHLHRNAEIVSWVVSGTLTHEDSGGGRSEVPAGAVQRLSAGAGVTHAERNRSASTPVRFIQMWLRPDETDTEPAYGCQRPVLRPGTWTDVAGGASVLHLRSAGAVLRVARVDAGTELHMPTGPLAHLFVVTGRVHIEGVGVLTTGDSLRLRDSAPSLQARESSELVAWALPDPQAIPQ